MSAWKLILMGLIRHVLGIVGAWLMTKGLIEPETADALLTSGVADVLGVVLIVGALLWSAFQKTTVWGWIRAALDLPAGSSIAKLETDVKRNPPPIMPATMIILLGVILVGGVIATSTGCQSTKGEPFPARVMALTEIATVQNAETALGMAQEFRILARDSAAQAYVGGLLNDAQLAKAKNLDTKFTRAWFAASTLVDTWRAVGPAYDRTEFDTTWSYLESVSAEMVMVNTGGGSALLMHDPTWSYLRSVSNERVLVNIGGGE